MRIGGSVLVAGGLAVGCTVYDSGLLADATGNGTLNGDGDASTGGATGDGDLSGDGDGDTSTGGATGDGDLSGDGDGDSGTGSTTSGTGGDGSNGGGTGSETGGSGSGGGVIGGAESLFDDFNDKNAVIKIADGRYGIWYAYTDETAADTAMFPGPNQAFETTNRGPDDEALRVTAEGFTDWGVGMFAAFDDDGGGDPPEYLEPYDLIGRGYDAVRFSAKKGSAEVVTKLALLIADGASTPQNEGGSCAEPCGYDHARAEVNLTTEWKEYTVLLSSFGRIATATPIDFTQAFHLHVAQEGEMIDFWVDDIRFVDLDE